MRDLGLEGLPNARDLGGYVTVDGRTVRDGVLFRADAPVRASDSDLAALSELGMLQVIDLRGAQEVEIFGLVTWNAPRVHLPVSDVAQEIVAMVRDAAVQAGDAERMMIGMYRSFVSDEVTRGQFARALELIVANGPLLFHCTAGKDRTGWLSAIVLTALGVERDVVFADYLLTNERFTTGRGAAGRQHLLDTLQTIVADVNDLMPVLEARQVYLEAAFDEVEIRYGSFGNFLRDGLQADVEGLRAALLK